MSCMDLCDNPLRVLRARQVVQLQWLAVLDIGDMRVESRVTKMGPVWR